MNNKKPPKRVNRKALFESKLVNFYADTVVMPNGHQIDSFYYLEFGFSTVAVIVERSDNCILLEEVARYPTQSVKWELPIGIIEADENMLDAAKREVHEETGYDTTEHKHLLSYHPVAGFSN